MTPIDTATLLLAARRNDAIVSWRDILPTSAAGAYAVQDATMAQLGPVGGWKVGAKSPHAEPACAPLPLSGLLASGCTLTGKPWKLRGMEAEAALRLGRDLDPMGQLLSPQELAPFFDAVLPVIEVVETRLADRPGSAALAQLADLQNHGALVLGTPSALSPAQLNLHTLQATLFFDAVPVANTVGGNPTGDVWRLLAWLALHCAQRGQPLKAGQIITTGSCTGLLFAAEGAQVRAELAGLGRVALRV